MKREIDWYIIDGGGIEGWGGLTMRDIVRS